MADRMWEVLLYNISLSLVCRIVEMSNGVGGHVPSLRPPKKSFRQ